LSVPAQWEPRHDGGRWATVRYALDSNARTFRLCLILLVTAISPVAVAVAAVLIHHMLLCGGSSGAAADGACRGLGHLASVVLALEGGGAGPEEDPSRARP
jgi:hypothetical protein